MFVIRKEMGPHVCQAHMCHAQELDYLCEVIVIPRTWAMYSMPTMMLLKNARMSKTHVQCFNHCTHGSIEAFIAIKRNDVSN